ncbi:hypothetical protein GEMRC1_011453 [Eukaryota sp. GEM-RC1]
MSLTVLYRLQFFYASLGISYNLVSLILQQSGADPLSATSAVSGIAAMIVYLLFLIPGVLKLRSLYRALMAVATVVLGYGGVITHLMNINDLQLYSSIAAWIIAIVINLFGLILNVTALSEGIHEQSEKRQTPAAVGRNKTALTRKWLSPVSGKRVSSGHRGRHHLQS